jgi:glycosyltransferase involved in cell wall biosynthesis
MTQPLISIVIPAYNAEKYIEESVHSMTNQTYSNLEILVADDGSTDSTRSIIEKLAQQDKRIKAYPNTENLGYLKTCNKLKAICTGDFIMFQDSDDYSSLNRAEILHSYLERHPEIAMVGSNFTKILEDGTKVFDSDQAGDHKSIIGPMPELFNFCGATFMLRTEVYKTIGPYNEYFDRVGAEDMYWVYLISEKFKIHILPDHLYYYRFNPNSVSSTIDNKKKLFSMDLARFLISERIKTGTDSLESNSPERLESHLNELYRPYEEDKLLLKKKLVKRFFWNGKYGKAYKIAFGIILRNPFQSKKFYKDLYIYLPAWLKGSKGRKY